MVNLVVLIGRLTRDPEITYTGSGVPRATFTLAVDRDYVTESGKRDTDFITCVAWRRTAETMANHLHKGRLISVQGAIQVNSYQTSEGEPRKRWDVRVDKFKFLDRAPAPPSASEEVADVPQF